MRRSLRGRQSQAARGTSNYTPVPHGTSEQVLRPPLSPEPRPFNYTHKNNAATQCPANLSHGCCSTVTTSCADRARIARIGPATAVLTSRARDAKHTRRRYGAAPPGSCVTWSCRCGRKYSNGWVMTGSVTNSTRYLVRCGVTHCDPSTHPSRNQR